MGHPIKDQETDAKVRELRAGGMPLARIARTLKIGINRVRRILGRPLPPSCTAEGQSAYRATHPDPRAAKPKKAMKSITIPLTDAAYARLAAIADTSYLSPDAFAALVVASYIAYQPEQIVLQPREPEDEEAEEPEEGSEEEDTPEESPDEGEPPADEPPGPEREKDSAKDDEEDAAPEEEPDYSYIKPGHTVVLVEDDSESLVWVSQIKAKGGVVKGPGDKVVVKRKNGVTVEVIAGELDPNPEG